MSKEEEINIEEVKKVEQTENCPDDEENIKHEQILLRSSIFKDFSLASRKTIDYLCDNCFTIEEKAKIFELRDSVLKTYATIPEQLIVFDKKSPLAKLLFDIIAVCAVCELGIVNEKKI